MTRDCKILLLQGGGALGAYQGGAAEALIGASEAPDWVAGISIGAINAALLAGNAPGDGVAAMRAFWTRISAGHGPAALSWLSPRLQIATGAAEALGLGAPGFFAPRFPPAAAMPPGSAGATSYYDTAPLRKTLLELVDFDRLNAGPMRFSVGAVNVATGNMTWFDCRDTRIRPEHVMASGALPPGFPAVEIDGAFYWDGGLVSNAPLSYVLDAQDGGENLTIYQIDLWSARGRIPDTVWAVDSRVKDIRFSSRTRLNTDLMRTRHEMHQAARRLARRLPPEFRDDPDLARLMHVTNDPRIRIAHLIYKERPAEDGTKDFEFSRPTMLAHWQAGRRDAIRGLAHPGWQARHVSPAQIDVIDLAEPGPTPATAPPPRRPKARAARLH